MTDTELVARLERLERDNRWLKRVALGALVLVAASIGLGAAYAKPAIPQRIVAHEFDVVDGQGRTRAKLDVANERVALKMFPSEGTKPALLLGVGPGKSAALVLANEVGNPRAALGYGIAGPGATLALMRGNADAALNLGADGSPALRLSDKSGYESVLGVTDLVTPTTGETHETSAASLVMFGKKHHVIWEAPQQ